MYHECPGDSNINRDEVVDDNDADDNVVENVHKLVIDADYDQGEKADEEIGDFHGNFDEFVGKDDVGVDGVDHGDDV